MTRRRFNGPHRAVIAVHRLAGVAFTVQRPGKAIVQLHTSPCQRRARSHAVSIRSPERLWIVADRSADRSATRSQYLIASFEKRKADPLKPRNLSPIDMASLDKWDEYVQAKKAMFFYTDTTDVPWTVVKSDCKKRARINTMRYVLHALPYKDKDLDMIGPVDPLLVGRATVVYERGERGNVSDLL